MDKQISAIIREWKDGTEEPLDGDEVDRLIRVITAKINLKEGNITEDEHEKILG